MGSTQQMRNIIFYVFFGLCASYQSFAIEADTNLTALLRVDVSEASGHKASDTLFGIFFEEINHAGAGGLWAELVSNRGFEAGGQNIPSNIDPWSIIGDESSVIISTDRSSCFTRNPVALRMEVICDSKGSNVCPAGGVGIYNPGYWGMNIELGKTYKVVLYVKSLESVDFSVSLASSNGSQILALANIIAAASVKMANSLFFSSFLLLVVLSSSSANPSTTDLNPNSKTPNVSSAHGELKSKGFPVGLLPTNVFTYALNQTSGDFSVHLIDTCKLTLPPDNYLAQYSKKITGKLVENRIADLKGIRVRAFYQWWSITGIRSSGENLVFEVGMVTAKYPSKNFDEVPACDGQRSSS